MGRIEDAKDSREPSDSPMTSAQPSAPHILATGASTLLWLAACSLPAFSYQYLGGRDAGYASGGWCALYGPLGIFHGCVAWYANPAAVAASSFLWLRRYRYAALCSTVAVLLAVDVVRLFGAVIPVDESETPKIQPQHLALGFWVWLLSLAIPGATALWLRGRKR